MTAHRARRYTFHNMALLALKNVNVRQGGKWALWDVSLEINAGEIVGVFGRSGSGKTTLGRVVAGIEEPTSGSVTYCGNSDNAPIHVSMALARPACVPERTVQENLELFAALWSIPRRKRAKEIAFMLEMLKLSDFRSSKTSLLGSGALQRLELARALLADCPMLVIDSLLDTLDRDIYERLWEHLMDLRRIQMRSVLILTSSDKTASVCPRVAVMRRGRIDFSGRPEDFRRLAGEDMLVLGDIHSSAVRSKIQERFAIVVKEEDGFLSLRVTDGERIATELLAEFGSELGCIYLKRPTLEDALDVLEHGSGAVTAAVIEREIE